MDNHIEVTLQSEHSDLNDTCAWPKKTPIVLSQLPGHSHIDMIIGTNRYMLERDQLLAAIDFLLTGQISADIRMMDLTRRLNDANRQLSRRNPEPSY